MALVLFMAAGYCRAGCPCFGVPVAGESGTILRGWIHWARRSRSASLRTFVEPERTSDRAEGVTRIVKLIKRHAGG